MLRDKAVLGASLASRIVSGIGALIILAWYLPAHEYGLLVTALACGQIIGTFTNFGFNILIVRDTAENPQNAGAIISSCMRIKNFFVVVATSAVLALVLVSGAPELINLTLFTVYGSAVVMSYSELIAHSYRGLQKYREEAVLAVFGNTVYLMGILSCVLISPDLSSISLTLFAMRSLQVAAGFVGLGRQLQFENLLWSNIREMGRFLRRSLSLGVDSTLTALASQVDVILVSATLGFQAVAGYQVASRLANYALLPAQILMATYLPKIASAASREAQRKLHRSMQIEFSVCGMFFMAALIVFSEIYPKLIQDDFDIGQMAWVGFSVMVLTRYLIATRGALLIIWRAVRFRVTAQIVNVAIILLGMPLLLPRFGVQSAPWVIAVAAVFTGAIYEFGYRIALRGLSEGSDKDDV